MDSNMNLFLTYTSSAVAYTYIFLITSGVASFREAGLTTSGSSNGNYSVHYWIYRLISQG